MTAAAATAWLEADWPAPPGVRALTTLRHGLGISRPPFDAFNLGARCGDEADAVAENRRQLEAALGLPSAPRWLKQVHGIDVARLEGATPSRPPPSLGERGGDGRPEVSFQADADALRSAPSLSPQAKGRVGEGCSAIDEPEADASVTSTPGVVLAILTADCLPVVFAARDGGEIAAAHAGWRSLAGGVLEATVVTMRTPASEIVAWLGPCAGPAAYEIGREVFDAFVSRDGRAATAFVATRPGHWTVDLYALARLRLVDAGLDPGAIHGGGLCTISDPSRFFSHRRDQRTGRMATLAWIAR